MSSCRMGNQASIRSKPLRGNLPCTWGTRERRFFRSLEGSRGCTCPLPKSRNQRLSRRTRASGSLLRYAYTGGTKLPTHRASSAKAGAAFGVTEQSVTLQASRTSVGLANAVPVALTPAKGQIDRSSLGSNPGHHFIHFSRRKRRGAPINLAFRRRRAYRRRCHAHRKKGEKRDCQRFGTLKNSF
jgi:hypothetical protein